MRRLSLPSFILSFYTLFASLSATADVKTEADSIYLQCFVKESLWKTDIVNAKVIVTDSLGQLVDSVSSGGYFTWNYSTKTRIERGYINVTVPRKLARYTFEVSYPGYQTAFRSVTIDKIGAREKELPIPDFILQREPKKLDEVTVISSKVKFYHRGDTVVYNADAFELAEGSMLDALIKQLPGVELRDGGQIFVNGKLVESLLLNGKQFFNGNNELMLENLASYTVKSVEVYKRTTDYNRWANNDNEDEKLLTMDVKLKKEYNAGWIANIEGGVGTADRYMARAFLNRYTNHSRITLIGNINNVSDRQKPGENSSWTPENNNNGTLRTKMAGLDYSVDKGEDWKLNGNAQLHHSILDNRQEIQRTNFLSGGDTYDYSFSNNHSKNLSISTSHEFQMDKYKKYFIGASGNGAFNKSDAQTSYLAATFDSEHQNATYGMLDSLYLGSPDILNDLINRTRTRTFNSSRSANGRLNTALGYMIPGTNDIISLTGDFNYNMNKSEVWRDYIVNYGANPNPAIRENQYIDNSPNQNTSISLEGQYQYILPTKNRSTINVSYRFNHSDSHRDSYSYVLDRLADQGVFGSLPEGYLSTLNTANSYRSHTIQNKHDIKLYYSNHITNNIFLAISPLVQITDRDFTYYRANNDFDLRKTNTTFNISFSQLSINFGDFYFQNNKYSRHSFLFSLNSTSTLPDQANMVNVTDNSDPMNIWTGNPDLTYSTKYDTDLYYAHRFQLNNRLYNAWLGINYVLDHNAIINGYTYDTNTGVRVFRAYNVRSGNYNSSAYFGTQFNFGRKSQFTLNYRGNVKYTHATDMIGVNSELPEQSSVYTINNTHNLYINWSLGKHQLTIDGSFNNRYTNSDRTDFNSINATDYKFGARGSFKLPYGLSVASDFIVYMRRGYGSPELDTTEPVWNARLTYTLPNKKWNIMLDGFDLLRQLSNVQYAVNAQGRTVTYTNVLPRYAMLHIQYHINILPKKSAPQNNVKYIDY